MLIRQAHPGDEPQVAQLHVRAWKHAYPGLLPQDFLDALTPADRIPGYAFAESHPGAPTTLLAFDGETLLGFSTFGPSRDGDLPTYGEIYALYVDPDRWRTGAGRTLLEHTRAELHDRGHRHALLWVLLGNATAERFYEADGWRFDGAERQEDPWGVLSVVCRFRRALP